MKTIKLLMIFAIILGGVVGAFFIIGGSTTSKIDKPIINPYQTYRKQFENDWKSKGDWSDSLFNAQCEMVKMLSLDNNVAPLKDFITTTAIEVVYKRIFEEWASTSCNKNKIENYIRALATIQAEDKNAKENQNVQEIKSVNETYKKAYALAHKHIGMSPNFDGTSWKSFNNYSTLLLSEKMSIQKSANYKQYLSNIKEIKDGINAIPNKLDNARKRFYNDLAYKIVNHYSHIPQSSRTRSQLIELRNTRNKYNNEAPSSNNYLKDFCQTFADDVDRNESDEEK